MTNDKETAEPCKFPLGGRVVGTLVDLLNMKGVFEDDDWPYSRKTAQRYLEGHHVDDAEQRTSEEVLEAIHRYIVDAAIPEGGMPDALEELFGRPRKVLSDFLHEFRAFWNGIAGSLNPAGGLPTDPGLAFLGAARLATFAAAVRWGAYQVYRHEDGLEPNFEPLLFDESAFETFLDGYRTRSVSKLAKKIGIGKRTLTNWKKNRNAPSYSMLRYLAEALSETNSQTKSQIETRLRLGLGISRLHSKLRAIFGRRRVAEFTEGFWGISRLSFEVLTAGDERMTTDMTKEMVRKLIRYGLRDEPGELLCEGLYTVVMGDGLGPDVPPIACDLRALAENWTNRLHYWNTLALEVETTRNDGRMPPHYRTTGKLFDGWEKESEAVEYLLENATWMPHWVQSPVDRDLDKYEAERSDFDPETLHGAERRRWDAAVQYNVALQLLSIGRTQDCIARLEDALALAGDNATVHHQFGAQIGYLGAQCKNSALVERGIEACREAARLEPDWAQPRNDIALLHAFLGHHEEAEQGFAAVAPDMKGDWGHHHSRGMNMMWMGSLKKAIKHLRRSLTLEPDYYLTRIALGICLYEIGRRQPAKKLARDIRERTPYDDILNPENRKGFMKSPPEK